MINKILSLDTSSSSTGWCYFENGKYVDSGVIDFKAIKDTDERTKMMVLEIYKYIEYYSPTAVITEMTVVVRNPAVQRLLTMILGAVYGKCIVYGIDYFSLRPTEWRKLIDSGKKPRKRDELKEWSKQKVYELYGIENVTDDVSDAILIGQAYINMGDD